jgi:formylglycine-generating enzyme required for sulfatase activity/cephalosporin-C deacetylase-like acetyl esterase
MSPERWQQVERLYHAALECDLAVRAQFLEKESGGDVELLDEVQSLLRQPDSGSRMERPVWERSAESSSTRWGPGARLGSYTLEAPLGRGGMGDVFRARDHRLNRSVAIKISKQLFTGRIKREAQAAAALTHPNIVHIYELGSAAGEDYIAMELVEGRTLAALLEERRLAIEEVLEFARQIASALAAAHTAGIVHRDIKPGNIVISGGGVVKVLDFGLAKREPGSASGDSTLSLHSETQPGTVLGTPSYMSPEQAEGRFVDARSDVFSAGAVLYEMFTGVRAFGGDSKLAILNRVVHETPPEIRALRPEVPLPVQQVIRRCLEKDPAQRYTSGVELANALTNCSRPARSTVPSARARAGIAAALLVAVAAAGWVYHRDQRLRWVHNEALPKIQALILQGDYVGAFALTRSALSQATDDPQLKQHWANVSLPLTMTTVPAGATISIRRMGDDGVPWQRVGQTPLNEARVPFANVRMRVQKNGMETLEFAAFTLQLQDGQIRLHPAGAIPSGMVAVPEQAFWTEPVRVMPLPEYFIDKYEVTNGQYQRFVDSGAYHTERYWRHPFLRNGHVVAWREAVAAFRDSTGREGPSVWELGTFPKDRADYPVAGVSWFEAAAYCEAEGKSLPTAPHWQKAAGFGIFSDILLFSNFTHKGPMRVGENPGITPAGAYDMAGNVKEWIQNEAGDRRLILGGSFDEPGYTFHDLDAQDPFARLPGFGIRCVSFPTSVPEAAFAPISPAARDYSQEKPVGDETFEILQGMYAYDKAPLVAQTENIDDSNELWRKETVSYAAAYGGERIPAYIFLPKKVKPPYQAVLWVPGGYAMFLGSSATGATTDSFDFLIRTGRVVLYPVYKGTFERHIVDAARPNAYREMMIEFAKDASRSVDYLETRSDIQGSRIGYYGISLGGTLGPVLLALDARLKAAALVSGGLYSDKAPPEIDVLNFAPRVRVPVLMLGGRFDFATPPEVLQRPMFRFLGTRDPDKQFIQFDAGHVPPMRDLQRETLNWFDRHLGPVAGEPVRDRQH